MSDLITRTGKALVVAGVVVATAFSANAQPEKSVSFDGKTVELWVPFGTGGGTDRFARMFQPFLKKYLPGDPNVVVFNKPGGASITATNLFHSRAPKDGTAILAVSISTLSGYALGNDMVKFEPKEWKSLIAVPAGAGFYANPETTGATGKNIAADMKALKSKQIVFGLQNPQASDIRGYLALRSLGIDLKPVLGLSKGDMRQAVLRGELDVGYDAIGAFIEKDMPYIKNGKFVPLFSFGFGPDFGPDPVLTDMPTYLDYHQATFGKAPSGVEWEALKMVISLSSEAAKALVLPPQTPEEIVSVYDEAISKIVEDPEFLKLAEVEFSYPFYVGNEARKALIRATSGTPEAKAWLKDVLKKDFGIE